MKLMSILEKSVLVALVATQMIMPAAADDCAPIVSALKATATAPALKQFFFVPGRPGGERLMSIQIGDAAYLAMEMGGPTVHWQKMSRSAMLAEAEKELQGAGYKDCKMLGSETVNGSPVSIYEYAAVAPAGGVRVSAGRSKVLIGRDGLVQKQETAGGATVRYEYNGVTAPN
jgi:hypothetical protein